MRNFLAFILLALGLYSCSGEVANYEFESYKWSRSTSIGLNFQSNSNDSNDLVLEVRSIYGFNHPNLELEFVLTQPNGQKVEVNRKLSFAKELMDCSGDFCDQLITIYDDFQFSEGAYSLSIKPVNGDKDLLGFMEFRLIRK